MDCKQYNLMNFIFIKLHISYCTLIKDKCGVARVMYIAFDETHSISCFSSIKANGESVRNLMYSYSQCCIMILLFRNLCISCFIYIKAKMGPESGCNREDWCITLLSSSR